MGDHERSLGSHGWAILDQSRAPIRVPPVRLCKYDLQGIMAEHECAAILDYHGVPWEYEPRTFVLESDAAGNVIEAFTPDFYLPEQELYLEITTMKQSLVTKKNRKMR